MLHSFVKEREEVGFRDSFACKKSGLCIYVCTYIYIINIFQEKERLREKQLRKEEYQVCEGKQQFFMLDATSSMYRTQKKIQ